MKCEYEKNLRLFDKCVDVYIRMLENGLPQDLTKELYGLIIDIRNDLERYRNAEKSFIVRKTCCVPSKEQHSQKRWVTIDGRHVDIGGDGDSGSGGGAVYYAGLKDKFSAIKDKIRNKTTPEKYKEVSDEYLESLPKLTEPESIEQSLAGTNPHGYTTNCQRCVPVYEMRRRGYDVAAADAPKNFLNDNIGLGDYKKVFIGAKWTICEGTGKDEITNYLQKCGNGARVEITINTNIGNHIFVAEQVGNTTVFIDPQRGSDKVDKYFKMMLTEPTKYCRIDNLKPSNLIKDCIGV